MYRRDGVKKRYKLGTYPSVSLDEARRSAREEFSKIDKGIDPSDQRAAFKAESAFAELSNEYLERYAKKNLRSWQQDERRLRISIIPAIGRMRTSLVTDADVIRLHDAITDGGAPVEANRQVALVRRIYSWAISRRVVTSNPAEKLQWNEERHRDRY